MRSVGSAHRIFDHIHMNVYWCIIRKCIALQANLPEKIRKKKQKRKESQNDQEIYLFTQNIESKKKNKNVGADKFPCKSFWSKYRTCCFGLRSDRTWLFSPEMEMECLRFHWFLFGCSQFLFFIFPNSFFDVVFEQLSIFVPFDFRLFIMVKHPVTVQFPTYRFKYKYNCNWTNGSEFRWSTAAWTLSTGTCRIEACKMVPGLFPTEIN